jgi:hypothetical protein
MLKTVKISNLIIICLSAWAIYASVSVFFGLNLYFPLVNAEEANIPYHRLQIVRVAVLLTFAYFGIVHLLKGSEPLYPIQFLTVYLKMLVLTAIPICVIYDVVIYEYFVVLFFLVCAIILHLASKPRYRKYFSTRK